MPAHPDNPAIWIALAPHTAVKPVRDTAVPPIRDKAWGIDGEPRQMFADQWQSLARWQTAAPA